MTENLPSPPVSPEADLRGLPFMPLDVIRLMDSDLFALSTGDEFKAAVSLWCKSWTQLPPGSIPQDDRVLAHLSGAGSKWKKVKVMAIHGFVLCSDGRLYHPVVCEKVIEAWESRVAKRDEVEGDKARKQREREERTKMFATLREQGRAPAWNTSTRELRELLSREPVTPVTDLSRVTSHEQVTDSSRGQSRLRQGQGQGQVEEGSVPSGTGAKPPQGDPVKQIFDRGVAIYSAAGLAEQKSREILGKQRREFGDAAMLAAISACENEHPSEPVSFISGCLNRAKARAPVRHEGGVIPMHPGAGG